MKTYLISLLVILSSLAYSQESDIRTLLDEVKSKFTEVDDYVVDAEITVDVNFLNVPKSIAKIYFKQPDKVKLDSEGFAMLPKQGMNFSPAKLLNIDYTAIYVKNEIVDNYQTEVVKIIPNDSNSDLILSTLWIDPDYKIIRKIESTTKNTGTNNIHLYYDEHLAIGLPNKVEFEFSIRNFQLPSSITMDFDSRPELPTDNQAEITGRVEVKYSNYKINEGIPDSFFEEE
jgi:outer membrane lipoprotein-sorting protein